MTYPGTVQPQDQEGTSSSDGDTVDTSTAQDSVETDEASRTRSQETASILEALYKVFPELFISKQAVPAWFDEEDLSSMTRHCLKVAPNLTGS